LIASAKAGRNPHILTLAPPLNLNPKWFKDHVAYSIAKFGMSLCVLGMAEEFRDRGVAVNALWPVTVIATAAVRMIPGAQEQTDHMRKPDIVADAAHAIFLRDARSTTGRFFLDEEVLREAGVGDFDAYAVAPGRPLMRDLFLTDGRRRDAPLAVAAVRGRRVLVAIRR
jgi:citronellol/citronellal dehydrogenase